MYDTRPNLVIGFHGCDRSTRDSLLNNPLKIEKSEKPHDWLGHGMYFWEYNETRAMQWADAKAKRGEIKEPAVIGAVLGLGVCRDLLDSKYIELIAAYYTLMKVSYSFLVKPLPENKDAKNDRYKDKLIRELDCAVIEFMNERLFGQHQKLITTIGYSTVKIFDSTRGAFSEGGEAFPGSGIQLKSHIQICVRNPNNILGFFLPRNDIDFDKILANEYGRKKK